MDTLKKLNIETDLIRFSDQIFQNKNKNNLEIYFWIITILIQGNFSMTTNHKIYYKAAQQMNDIEDESIDLMITSPPYPMIEMWDEIFSIQNPDIKLALEKNEGLTAFEKKDNNNTYFIEYKEIPPKKKPYIIRNR